MYSYLSGINIIASGTIIFEVGEVEGGLGVIGAAGECLDNVGDGECAVHNVGRDGIITTVIILLVDDNC